MPRLVHFVIIGKRKKFGLGSVVVYLIEIDFLSKEKVFFAKPWFSGKFLQNFFSLEFLQKTWKK